MRQTRRIGPAKSARRGTILIYTTIGMIAFVAIVSLAVDVGHGRLVKNQLQNAADAAARFGAAGLQTSVSQAKNNAVTAAGNNTADATSVVVDPNADVEFGTWDPNSNTFTVLSGAAQSSANAIRVTARRVSARGTAVPLTFGQVVGKSSCDVIAQSIAVLSQGAPSGFIGLGGINLQNNEFIAGYNSSNTTNPTHGSSDNKGLVGSNGKIAAQNNVSLQGDAVLGPGGSISGVPMTGSTTTLSSPIAGPTMPGWSPGTNPGSVPQNYVVASNTTLPGGSYWFTSLTVTSNLTFSGPATLYVNGNITLGGSLTAYNNVPGNLRIYQLGTNKFSDTGGNNLLIIADFWAPGCDFTVSNKLEFCGRGIFETFQAKNNADLYVDEALGATMGASGVSIVQ